MEIKIRKTGSSTLTGTISGTVNTYVVTEDGREFCLARISHTLGASTSITGKEGILYVDSDDNKVHRQVTAPGGACGLNTDDEVVEGFSPFALRAMLVAEQCNEPGEITITIKER